MRTIKSLLVTAAAGALMAGTIGIAEAASQRLNTMTIQLPDGGTARIQYTGDVAPKVTVTPGWQAFDTWGPGPLVFDWTPPFAAIDSISAEMERHMAAAQRQMQAMQEQLATDSDRPIEAALKNAPPGSESFSIMTISNGKGFCTRSVRVVKPENGKPQVQRQSSGDCSGMSAGTANETESLSPNDTTGLTSIDDRDPRAPAMLHEATAVQTN